nr:hypothetical protein BaRGS_023716 [Batillaria attramentaria]
MASSRRKTEIRLAPKHLDKMLFINYKEEEKLQHRLQTLTNSSRLRGYELDREKIQVHKEMRLSKRRNSAPNLDVATVPTVTTPRHSTRPTTRETSRGFNSRRGSVTDPVNDYLLTEFRRVSEVIPSILSSLNKDDKRKEEGEEEGGDREGGGRRGRRRATVPKVGDVFSSLAAPRVRLDPDLARFASKETDGQVNIGNIVDNIRTIKTLREEIAGHKRLETTKAKTSFKDLLKNIREEESKGSDSDTFTDGACSLLRRKMHKARRASMPTIETQPPGEPGGGGEPRSRKPSLAQLTQTSGPAAVRPPMPVSRSATSLASIGRQGSRDFDSMMRSMLLEEDRQMTELKVASELQRYDRICARIGSFLDDVGNSRRASLPVLPGLNAQQGEDAT